MIVHTPAIVLKSFPFGDTSIIARCFSEEKGKISLIVKGARSKKSPKSAQFQPLSYVDVIYYHKPNRDLQVLSKVNFRESWQKILDNLRSVTLSVALLEMTEKTLIDEDIQGTHGFHHYDTHVYQYDPSDPNSAFSTGSANVLSEEFYPYNQPTAIYIKGGQVLVHGRYKGKYTIITDEYTAYRRHAWSPNFSSPTDTVWCNIWLVDDIRNVDGSTNGSLYSVQPDEDCTGGSSNVMGIVSGANVIIANTKANGARGSSYGTSITIHAHIIAFNESFTMHYWQNRTQTPYGCANGSVWGAGYGDCNGDRFGGNFSGQSDLRGTVNLWGGVVQKYRGYMKRNQPGPYSISPGIGMDKSYHYDNNLKCFDPPLYPESVFCDDESCGGEATEGKNQINLKIASYKEF